MIKIKLVTLTILLLCVILGAQTPEILFEQFTTADGLTHNEVNYIFQDKMGFLWIGTSDGLNRYDGYRFKHYKNNPQDSTSLAFNAVYFIMEDSQGRLWFGTGGGISRYNRSSDNFTNFAFADKNDNRFSNSTLKRFVGTSTNIREDEEGLFWIGTILNGVVRFDPETGRSVLYNTSPYEVAGSFDNSAVYLIPVDNSPNKQFWLANILEGFQKFDAESGKVIDRYRSDPDIATTLSDNRVLCLAKDKAGFVWIGTDNGLNRFDPASGEFSRFLTKPVNPAGSVFYRIWDIYPDPVENVLWVCTDKEGLYRHDLASGQFQRFSGDAYDNSGLSSSKVQCAFRDRSGVLWVGTQGGLNKFDPSWIRFDNIEIAPQDKNSLSSNNVYRLYKSPAKDNVLWIATYGGGLNKYDETSNSFTRFGSDPARSNTLNTNDLRSVYEDKNGILWVGTRNLGLERFNPRTGKVNHFNIDIAFDNTVTSPIRDIVEWEGFLWLGTSSGLYRFDKKRETFSTFTFQDTSYTDEMYGIIRTLQKNKQALASLLGIGNYADTSQTFSITKNKKALIVSVGEGQGSMYDFGWLEDNAGFKKWNMEYRDSRHAGGATKNRVQMALIDLQAGRYALRYKSDDSHAYGAWNEPNPANQEMWGIEIFEVPDDLVNHIENNIYKINKIKPNSIAGNNVNSLVPDNNGRLWVGTLGFGLDLFDPETETFRHFKNSPADPNSLSNNFINDIYQDDQGYLWVATQEGLNRLDPVDSTFTRFGTAQGLANSTVFAIEMDHNSDLWLSTANGISKAVFKDGDHSGSPYFVNYGQADGIKANTYHSGAACKSGSGKIYFAGNQGIVSFFPTKINEQIPVVRIVDFKVFNQPVAIGKNEILKKHITETDKIVIPHDKNMFTFEFVTLHLSRPEKNHNLFKLEGFDKTWLDGSSHFASYTNISPGKYTFRVKGSNNDGIWNEEGAAIEVTVLPPWYRTVWAYILYVLLFAAFIFAFDRFQRARITKRERERSQIREMELRAQKAEAEARAVNAENERKSAELEKARQLQLSMLPKTIPQLPNLEIAVYMKTATEVGGDYYDFHLSSDGTLTVAVGDATGHGLNAGMIVTASKSLFETLAADRSAVEMIEQSNRVIKQMSQTTLRMAMTVLKIRGDKMIASGAGMPPVIIYREATNKLEELAFEGMPLGSLSDFPYVEKKTDLYPGDTIVVMSDGFPERMNPDGEMLDYESAYQAILAGAVRSPQELINHLVGIGDNWADGRPQDDDVTFVVMEIK